MAHNLLPLPHQTPPAPLPAMCSKPDALRSVRGRLHRQTVAIGVKLLLRPAAAFAVVGGGNAARHARRVTGHHHPGLKRSLIALRLLSLLAPSTSFPAAARDIDIDIAVAAWRLAAAVVVHVAVVGVVVVKGLVGSVVVSVDRSAAAAVEGPDAVAVVGEVDVPLIAAAVACWTAAAVGETLGVGVVVGAGTMAAVENAAGVNVARTNTASLVVIALAAVRVRQPVDVVVVDVDRHRDGNRDAAAAVGGSGAARLRARLFQRPSGWGRVPAATASVAKLVALSEGESSLQSSFPFMSWAFTVAAAVAEVAPFELARCSPEMR